MKTPGQYLREAIALSHDCNMLVFFQMKSGPAGPSYKIWRRAPNNRPVPVAVTRSPSVLLRKMKQALAIEDAPAARSNPTMREDAHAATLLANKFHGRLPGDNEYTRVAVPKMPKALANIGPIHAIEYLAERDGKEYRFRHVFKVRSRPALAVSPDGSIATMLGGAWRFTEDGFVDS